MLATPWIWVEIFRKESVVRSLPKMPVDSNGPFAWLWTAVNSGRGLMKTTCQFHTVRAVVETALEAGVTTANGDEA
ncbi:hypothetical protein GRJ2_002291700 [Grus japonensis]|uniref:Uncharacterized protein n=1 Tax=Grus japonensis TaxID=30415 RepID=A0ABC9XKN1_GRUJA